jgi:ABC-type transporter Mla subunit MlaD
VERFEELPRAAAPLVESVGSLRELADTLGAFQQSLQEALFLLPSASDYEPLAEPLRRFAQTSPALVESLDALARLAGPLSASVDTLGTTTEKIDASSHSLTIAVELASRLLREVREASAPAPSPPTGILRESAGEIEAVRSAIVGALESLPRASDYAPLASQLRELATVSPSLMSWLQELPAVTVPLGQSVEGLWSTVSRLKAAGAALERAAEETADRTPGAQAEEALGRLVALRQRLAESPPEDDRLRETLREIGRESARLRRLARRPGAEV